MGRGEEHILIIQVFILLGRGSERVAWWAPCSQPRSTRQKTTARRDVEVATYADEHKHINYTSL